MLKMNIKKVVLAGNSTMAELMYDYLKQDIRYEVVATTVSDEFLETGSVDEIRSVGLSRLIDVYKPNEVSIIMAVGYDNLNRVREKLFFQLKSLGYLIETYVHPDAKIYTTCSIGEGAIILPSAVVEPQVFVGANTVVWCNVSLAHHSTIAENCWIASGGIIAGKSTICRNTFLGVNATVVNGINVGEFNIIGAGALISKSTDANTVHLSRSAELWRYSAEDYVKYFEV